MTIFRREADRLDAYLDDQAAGRTTDPDGLHLDPALIDTWTWAKTAMAHTPSDPDAKADTWRTLMQAQFAAAAVPSAALTPPARRADLPAKPHWSHRAMAFAATIALATGLVIGIAGYDRFGGGGSPNDPTGIPAASFLLPGTPQATGCDVPRREPGAIEKIMETPPSRTPYFPRVNKNPLTDPLVGTGKGSDVADGTSIWTNSSPDASMPDGIQQLLDTLYDCRAYALDSQGRIDMEGSYFSLYSDDYFRRELNGFAQAGLPLEINTFWLPSTKPAIVEIRKLMDGDRYLVVLDGEGGVGGALRVLSVVPGENGAWYVDEVGLISEPQIDTEGTPIMALPNDVTEASPGTTEPSFIDQFPHALTVSIGDLAASNEDPWTCDEQDGTPIPCGGMGLSLLGPWTPNELPANVPFTYTFVNTGDVSTHIASPELGIDVDVPAGQQVDIEVDAEPGDYDIVFTQGAETSTRTWTFEPAGGQFSMG